MTLGNDFSVCLCAADEWLTSILIAFDDVVAVDVARDGDGAIQSPGLGQRHDKLQKQWVAE